MTTDLLLYHIHTFLLLRTLTQMLVLNLLMNTRLHIKIYKYLISNLACMKQTYSTTCVHEANPKHKQFLIDTLDPTNFTWRKCRKAAQNMKHHTAPGASGISIDMLMLLPEEGWQILSLVFQTIINTGVYPDSFKVGIMTLLAKSPTSHGTLDNIRPITVLESAYRLFTSMVSTRTTELFYKYDIIPKKQHACLIGRGSTTPIIQMNAAMKHTLDSTKNPKLGDQVRYKRNPKGPWTTASI